MIPISDDKAGVEDYLATNPGMTVRDWKGKGFHEHNPFDRDYVRPGEKPWHELDAQEVRDAATTMKARYLSKSQRQAAARDPALIWDASTLAYCLRPDGPPSPSTVAGTSTPPPPPKSLAPPTAQTGGGPRCKR